MPKTIYGTCYMEAFETKWINFDYILYGVNSLRIEGLHLDVPVRQTIFENVNKFLKKEVRDKKYIKLKNMFLYVI